MFILLPIIVFALVWRTLRLRGDSSREALLRAAVFCAALLVFITEALSLFYLVTRIGLVCAWLAALAGTLFLLARTQRTPNKTGPAQKRPLLHMPPRMRSPDTLVAAAIAFNLAIIGLIAIAAPPNSWDVMEHHLPRVLFWVSNHTLRVFPTPDYTQVMEGTAAESIILNTYLMWGSDRLANLVEFFSLVGSTFAASLIASRFGVKRTGQLMAALFVVTVPELVLESSGSMSTGVASFWIVSICFFLLRAGTSLSAWDILSAALATGLALLTKGITAVYLPS